MRCRAGSSQAWWCCPASWPRRCEQPRSAPCTASLRCTSALQRPSDLQLGVCVADKAVADHILPKVLTRALADLPNGVAFEEATKIVTMLAAVCCGGTTPHAGHHRLSTQPNATGPAVISIVYRAWSVHSAALLLAQRHALCDVRLLAGIHSAWLMCVLTVRRCQP
jgi:hypothetical protein